MNSLSGQSPQPTREEIRMELIRSMSYEASRVIAANPDMAEKIGQGVVKYVDTVLPIQSHQVPQSATAAPHM